MERMIDNNFSAILGKKLLKMTAVSKATGISRVTLSSIYNKKAKGITFEVLDKLCEYLECQPSDIFTYVKGCEVDNENRVMERSQN